MLRRKLLARLGVLVLGFVSIAIVSIALLQGILSDLNQLGAQAVQLIAKVQDLGDLADELPVSAGDERDRIVAKMIGLHADLAAQHVMHEGQPGFEAHDRIGQTLAGLQAGGDTSGEMLDALHGDVVELRNVARDSVASEQWRVSRNLRVLIIGLTAAALVMVNLSVIVLLRTGTMILRPVSALLEGSRQLAAERFDHRVRVEQADEFAELAHAYNALAEQLGANEQRKVETLQQLAITLNHELNNVISVIELQLKFLDRKAGGDQALGGHLRQIRESLGKIAVTVASLKDVRRIVVTDYIPGLKMLDLPKCTGDEGGSDEEKGVVEVRSLPRPVRS
ncbi:MAG: HAMP domain-containing protein [Phycisphaerales bacterium]|nr:HAMP domain-containing protein [Phycisphaerales bacterium]